MAYSCTSAGVKFGVAHRPYCMKYTFSYDHGVKAIDPVGDEVAVDGRACVTYAAPVVLNLLLSRIV